MVIANKYTETFLTVKFCELFYYNFATSGPLGLSIVTFAAIHWSSRPSMAATDGSFLSCMTNILYVRIKVENSTIFHVVTIRREQIV